MLLKCAVKKNATPNPQECSSTQKPTKQQQSPEKSSHKATSLEKKPVVLSSQRFAKLLSNANQDDKKKAQKEAEDEQKYQEYLKKGSDELVANFNENMPRTELMKREEMKMELDKKTKEGKSFLIFLLS